MAEIVATYAAEKGTVCISDAAYAEKSEEQNERERRNAQRTAYGILLNYVLREQAEAGPKEE